MINLEGLMKSHFDSMDEIYKEICETVNRPEINALVSAIRKMDITIKSLIVYLQEREEP